MWCNLTLTYSTSSRSSFTPSLHNLMIFPNTETRPFFVQQAKSGRWNVWVYQRATDEGHKYSVQQTLKNPDDAYSWGLNYINNVTKSYWVTLTHWAEGSLNILCPALQFTTLAHNQCVSHLLLASRIARWSGSPTVTMAAPGMSAPIWYTPLAYLLPCGPHSSLRLMLMKLHPVLSVAGLTRFIRLF